MGSSQLDVPEAKAEPGSAGCFFGGASLVPSGSPTALAPVLLPEGYGGPTTELTQAALKPSFSLRTLPEQTRFAR